mgnify:FL=1
MNYEIKIMDIEPILAATLRSNGKHKEGGKQFADIYKALKGQSSGPPFFCYYDKEYKETADIELCVPVSEKKELRGIIIKELPRIKAVTTVHTGSYETIRSAYQALAEYIIEKKLETALPVREVYIKGPGMFFKGNPDKYITEIIIPLK